MFETLVSSIIGITASSGDNEAPSGVDYSDSLDMMVESMKAGLAMQSQGQIAQTKMQSAAMQLQSMRMQMMQEGKLSANLEIQGMRRDVAMQEAQYRHDEKLLGLLNTHIEELADSGQIDAESLLEKK